MLLFFKSFLGAMLLALVAAQSNTKPVTGHLGNATVTKDNPKGVVYVAKLPAKQFFDPHNPRGSVKGQVIGSSGPDGVGVAFDVHFSNLPTSGGPFLYHLHADPVPSDGNCTGTGAHIDPFYRGEVPPCDPTLSQTCQVGDLSGKYGDVTSDPFTESYIDKYSSTLVGSRAFFGNGSLTVHFANKTRITCANFTIVGLSPHAGGNQTCNATSTHSATGTPIASPTSTPAGTNVSSANMVPVVTLFALLIAALMF